MDSLLWIQRKFGFTWTELRGVTLAFVLRELGYEARRYKAKKEMDWMKFEAATKK